MKPFEGTTHWPLEDNRADLAKTLVDNHEQTSENHAVLSALKGYILPLKGYIVPLKGL